MVLRSVDECVSSYNVCSDSFRVEGTLSARQEFAKYGVQNGGGAYSCNSTSKYTLGILSASLSRGTARC